MENRYKRQFRPLLKRQSAALLTGRAGAGTRGFSLVELLVAIFITGIIAGSIYTMYVNFFKTSHSQDILLEAQQNARIAINMMEREVLNAGYIAGTADILTVNTDAGQIEFLYTDPADPGVRLRVHYALATAGGVTYLTRKADNVTTGAAGNTEQVIPNAQTLAFLYYDKDGNAVALTGASTQAQRNTVRFVDVKLVTAVPERFLGAVAYSKTFTVQTHMNIRNLGIGQIALDTTAPATPTGLQVRDPGICGRLQAKWTRNTDGDLAGYKLYYGTAPGNYTGVINIPKSILSGSIYSCTQDATYITCTIFPKEKDPSTGQYTTTDTLIYTPSTAASGAGTKYYLSVEAYDTSYNYSNKTADAFGDPDPSNSDFGTAGNDSTINPVKPAPPASFTAMDGPSDGQVKLSWTYNTSAYPDVIGFRIYRSDASFSSVPIAAGQWIEGEPASGIGTSALSQTVTTYTDSDPSLLACKVYNYAIAAVNCDATLIPDNGGDTAAKKYGWTDYAATCGDGSAACTPGTSFASVTGSDTAPPKAASPGAPSITARAGWRRVAVTLTQPSDTDLDQTCAYADTSSYPTLNDITNPLATAQVKCFPPITGIRVSDPYTPPGYNGIFKAINDPADPLYMGLNYYLARSTPTTFWHSSMIAAPAAPTSAPSLADVATYYYKAVSFNRCGKPSTTNTSIAVTTLCFEDPPVCPDLDPTGYCQPDFGGKPPAVDPASIMVGCCDTDPAKRDSVTYLYPATISWTGITSSAGLASTQNNPYDLAGYRIFKNKNNLDWSPSVLITATKNAPMWGTNTSDTELSDAETNSDGFGGVYYYRVVTTDCPYEKVNPTEATIRTDMLGLGTAQLQSSVSPVVYPGKIDRTKKCAGALPCTKASPVDHREVVTGVDVSADNAVTPHRDTATAPYTSSFDYSHNTVTMFFNNTSAGTMTITDATVEWINVSAYLTKITIGGGRSGIGAVSTSFVNGDTIDFTNSPAPFTRGIALKTLTNATIPAWSTGEYVPITFEFKDSAGKPIDMRDDSLYVTFKAKNDQTGTSGSVGCVSYLTISQLQETGGVYIPLGPAVTTVLRNRPTSPTFDLAYPGSTGLNTVPVTGSGGTEYAPNPVVGGVSVAVSANIVSNTTHETTGSKLDISSAEVHYVETAITVAAAPVLTDAAWSDASRSGTVAMTGAAGGGIWTGSIPARVTTSGAKRVWYYVVAFDSDGNYDRLPKTTDGYYVYDQKPISVCDYTPQGVTTLEQWTTNYNTNVYFRWPAVTKYTDGSTIDTVADPIYYQIWRQTDTAAFQMVYKVKHSTTGCVWIASGSETYTSPVTAATGTLSPSTGYYAECNGTPNLYYWREDRAAGATDFANQVVSWYVVPQNSCSANGNAGAQSNTFKECVGSSTATIQITPSSIQYGDANTFNITVSDCSKVNAISGETVTDMVKLCSANLNAANCAGNSTYTTPPTYFTPYTITETLDSGVFTKTGAVASTTNTSGKVYVNPVGNTTTETDTVYVSCPTCSGPPAPVTLTVKSLACDRTPGAVTGVTVSRPTAGSDTVNVSWTARTEWDMAAGQTPTAAKYDIYRAQVTKTGSTCAACPAAASLTYLSSKSDGTVTYEDTTAAQGSGSSKKCYCYLVKAVDSCPLTSAASSIAGPL
ncbi:MAG: prepilin-type N-terminal cleavage/methylation domain-containing protein [Deltaproteobacteria bacterium]|nr:prepilin-type N-terminal cleavage/methylation domain-containing protein [Deltaproteobacteria bacterium]